MYLIYSRVIRLQYMSLCVAYRRCMQQLVSDLMYMHGHGRDRPHSRPLISSANVATRGSGNELEIAVNACRTFTCRALSKGSSSFFAEYTLGRAWVSIGSTDAECIHTIFPSATKPRYAPSESSFSVLGTCERLSHRDAD
jgi:hypothetical protein